jgi:Eukaryotic aspartyl protease
LVGVGYQANIAGLDVLINETYAPPTIVQAMVANGDIDRESYSLYLNDQNNGKGVIIFGGVDSTKYTGDLVALQTIPTNNGYSNYSAFNVALTGISIKDETSTRLLTEADFQVPALLDSGTTMTYLPPGAFDAISKGFGLSSYAVPCAYAQSSAALIYHFGGEGGPSIEVPIAAMLDPPDGSAYDDGTPACYLNVAVESEGTATLGDSFMRSGYFVYDLENNLVAIAQVAANVTNEDITPIPSGTEIPGCTSTNTLIIPETATATALGPMETASQTLGGSVLPGTPTFALGSAATATGGGSESGSGNGGGSSSDNAGVSLRVGGWMVALVAGAVLLAL